MLNWLKKNSFKIIIIVVVVIVIFLINFYLQMTKPVPKVKVQKENEITVNSLVAKVEDYEPFLSAFGRVKTQRTGNLSFGVSGTISHLSEKFVNGGKVKKGEVLGKLDEEKFILIVQRLQTDIKELSKQILELNPKLLILFDISEPSIYELTLEISDLKKVNIPIVNILGNACDERLVNSIFKKYSIDVVFHAAAYKHVPIVEKNSIEGMRNNILSTIVLTQASNKFEISKFILISTDKAVRPTNIMGLSKRIAELIVQSLSYQSKTTCFSMVRFGNVLGSSGSVVPLFKKQISNGGPITLTHPEVVRYFMSISEASQLVIQAAQLALGGEVFLLDMGDPLLIKDLAYQMVKLSGLTVRDKKNPEGDIEIRNIGLRPGEKLYEELLIDSTSMPTIHPLIYKAIEKKLDKDFFNFNLGKLMSSLEKKDLDETLAIAKEIVPEWIRSQD